MINYNKLNAFKKLYYGLKARTKIISDKYRFFQMGNQSSVFDSDDCKYRNDLSYRYGWFDLRHESTLAEWDNITDVINGGQSKAEIWYDKKEKCLEYEGYVQTRDKDRMIYYPFINITRSFPTYVKLGPMRLFQVEAKTDGKPLEVHFTLKSFIKGEVNIYGFILSKSTDWHTYQVPIHETQDPNIEHDSPWHRGGLSRRYNICKELGGASLAEHRSGRYFSKSSHSSVFDKEFDSVKKVLTTEVFGQNSVEISNVGFRLVSHQESQNRHIRIRKINFAYKKGYEQFVDSYQSPYFYIANDKVVKTQKVGWEQGQMEFLQNNLEDFDFIDTGDIKYYKNEKANKKQNKK